MQEGQLDGVDDLLYLAIQATDVLIRDVRHLLQDQVLHAGSGKPLQEKAGPRVQHRRVAAVQPDADELGAQLDDLLLVRTAHDHGPESTGHDLPHGDDLAGGLVAPGQHDAHGVVEDDLLARGQVVCEVGMHPDAHLAAARMDVGRPVVVDLDHGAVGRGWLGELLDLLAQHGNALPGRLQGGVELLVAGVGPRQLPSGVPHLGLQEAQLARSLDQAPAEFGDLALKIDRIRGNILNRFIGPFRDLQLVSHDSPPGRDPSVGRPLPGGECLPGDPVEALRVAI